MNELRYYTSWFLSGTDVEFPLLQVIKTDWSFFFSIIIKYEKKRYVRYKYSPFFFFRTESSQIKINRNGIVRIFLSCWNYFLRKLTETDRREYKQKKKTDVCNACAVCFFSYKHWTGSNIRTVTDHCTWQADNEIARKWKFDIQSICTVCHSVNCWFSSERQCINVFRKLNAQSFFEKESAQILFSLRACAGKIYLNS